MDAVTELVRPEWACPLCSERRQDYLMCDWEDAALVTCLMCGWEYRIDLTPDDCE